MNLATKKFDQGMEMHCVHLDFTERNSRPVTGGVRGEPRARQRAPPSRLAAPSRRLRRDAPTDHLSAGKCPKLRTAMSRP